MLCKGGDGRRGGKVKRRGKRQCGVTGVEGESKVKRKGRRGEGERDCIVSRRAS